MATPIWLRQLIHSLCKDELVAGVTVYNHHIKVRYVTNTSNRYSLDDHCSKRCPRLTKDQARITTKIVPQRQYEPDLINPGDNPYAHHLRLPTHEGTIIDIDLGVQRFVQAVVAGGYDPRVPPRYRDADLERLRHFDVTKCFSRKFVKFHIPRAPGLLVLRHFFPCGDVPELTTSDMYVRQWNPAGTLRGGVASTRMVFYACRLLLRVGAPLTTMNVYRWLSTGPSRYLPIGYMAIMRRLHVCGTVYDAHPMLGHKALACAMLGLPYWPAPDREFAAALAAGFAGYVGLRVVDGGPVSLAIADNNFRRGQLPLPDVGAGLTLTFGDAATTRAARARVPIAVDPLCRCTSYLYAW